MSNLSENQTTEEQSQEESELARCLSYDDMGGEEAPSQEEVLLALQDMFSAVAKILGFFARRQRSLDDHELFERVAQAAKTMSPDPEDADADLDACARAAGVHVDLAPYNLVYNPHQSNAPNAKGDNMPSDVQTLLRRTEARANTPELQAARRSARMSLQEQKENLLNDPDHRDELRALDSFGAIWHETYSKAKRPATLEQLWVIASAIGGFRKHSGIGNLRREEAIFERLGAYLDDPTTINCFDQLGFFISKIQYIPDEPPPINDERQSQKPVSLGYTIRRASEL